MCCNTRYSMCNPCNLMVHPSEELCKYNNGIFYFINNIVGVILK